MNSSEEEEVIDIDDSSSKQKTGRSKFMEVNKKIKKVNDKIDNTKKETIDALQRRITHFENEKQTYFEEEWKKLEKRLTEIDRYKIIELERRIEVLEKKP